jgi:diaminopimelate epimerase
MTSQSISFVKASACGNDFLIIEGKDIADFAGLTRKICDRHRGVGADGVEWIFPTADADLAVRLFNADGSEAEISGNGTRCVAAYWASQHDPGDVRIATAAGEKHCRLIDRSGVHFTFEAAMGAPEIQNTIPISTSDREFHGIPVSMGNPHFVVFEDKFPERWQAYAAEIQLQPHFCRGVNVEFVTVHNKSEIEVRLFERGVGETQSSGTGSCASAVAAISAGHCQSPVRVHAPGGSQTVRWEREVFLTRPASLVCSGEFFI